MKWQASNAAYWDSTALIVFFKNVVILVARRRWKLLVFCFIALLACTTLNFLYLTLLLWIFCILGLSFPSSCICVCIFIIVLFLEFVASRNKISHEFYFILIKIFCILGLCYWICVVLVLLLEGLLMWKVADTMTC